MDLVFFHVSITELYYSLKMMRQSLPLLNRAIHINNMLFMAVPLFGGDSAY